MNDNDLKFYRSDRVEYTILKIPYKGDLVIVSCINRLRNVCEECIKKTSGSRWIKHFRFSPDRYGFKYVALGCKYHAYDENDYLYYDNFAEVKDRHQFRGNSDTPNRYAHRFVGKLKSYSYKKREY